MTRDAEALLRRLEHEAVLEEYPVVGQPLRVVLGAASARVFRALHRPELESALAGLSGAAQPRERACRGRIRWLLGLEAKGRADLEAACEADPRDALAEGYLGVSWLAEDPQRALMLLRRSEAETWPRVWSAAARLRLGDVRGALALLERLPDAGPPMFAARRTRCLAFLAVGDPRSALADAQALTESAPAELAGFALRSQCRLALGDIEGALADHSRAKDRDPDYRFADMRALGIVAEASSRADAAGLARCLEQLDEAIARYPGAAFLYVEKAEILREPAFGRPDQALAEYRRAEAYATDCAWFQAQLARAETQAAGIARSLERLDRAVALSGGAGWIRAWRGEALRRLGRLSEALEDLQAAAFSSPAYAYGHAWLGAALLAAGRTEEARRRLDCALEMGVTYPTDGVALQARSRALRALGRQAEAVDDITRAFALDPKYAWAGREDDAAGAVADLDAALAQRPGDPWIHAWRGCTRLGLGDAPGAAEDLTRALELDPGHVWARLWRALALRAQCRAAEAEPDVEVAWRAEPGLPLAACLRAEQSAAAGDLEEALRTLEGASERGGIVAAFQYQRSELLLRLGRAREAADAARRALELDPRYADAHALLARALLELGDAAAALAEADAAIALRPQAAPPRLARAVALGRLERAPEQLEEFRAVYRLDPGLFAQAEPALLEALRR